MRYLTLAEALTIAQFVTGTNASILAWTSRLELLDSALHAPQAGFGEVEFYPEFRDKAAVLYDEIDAGEYYRGAVVNKEHRSWMNVTMRLPSEELEKKFIAEAAEVGLHGLKGHRSVGGIRASIYNAMPREGVERLVAFMKDFRGANQG